MEKLPIQSDHSLGNGNKWPDVENVLAAKSREVENLGRDYITESPFKAVLAIGVAGLVMGFLLSKIRA